MGSSCISLSSQRLIGTGQKKSDQFHRSAQTTASDTAGDESSVLRRRANDNKETGNLNQVSGHSTFDPREAPPKLSSWCGPPQETTHKRSKGNPGHVQRENPTPNPGQQKKGFQQETSTKSWSIEREVFQQKHQNADSTHPCLRKHQGQGNPSLQ